MSSRVKCVICGTVLAFDRADTWNLIQHLQEYHRHDWKRSYDRRRTKKHRQRIKSEDIVLEMESLPVLVESVDHDHDHDHDHQNCTVRDVIDRAVGSAEVTVVDKFVGNSPPPSSESSNEEGRLSVTSRDALEEKLIKESSGKGKIRKTLYKRMYRPRRSLRSGRVVSYRTTVENWRPGGMRINCPACGRSRLPVVRSHREHETTSSTWSSFLMCCWPLWCLPCCFPKPKREYLHCSACDAFLAMYDHEGDCIQPNFDLFEDG